MATNTAPDTLAEALNETIDRLKIDHDKCRVLASSETLILLQKFRARFVRDDLNRPWFWEHFKYPRMSVRFKDDKPWSRLTEIFPFDTEKVWLILENWDGKDFIVCEATIEAIQMLISDDYELEYYITPKTLSWLICENHHDYLIAVGDIAIERLRSVTSKHPDDILEQYLA